MAPRNSRYHICWVRIVSGGYIFPAICRYTTYQYYVSYTTGYRIETFDTSETSKFPYIGNVEISIYRTERDVTFEGGYYIPDQSCIQILRSASELLYCDRSVKRSSGVVEPLMAKQDDRKY